MNTTPLHLLIAEDEAAHIEAIRRAFEPAGETVEIRVVGTLREYRAVVADWLPDIAVVDLNLPDGKAMEILTQPPEDAAFPVLVMTAFGNQQIVVDVMKAGALDYVVKSLEAFARMPQIVESGIREWKLLQRHKQSEAALLESAEQHRTILQTAMDGFWLVDMEGRLLEVNAAYCRLSGYSASEVLALRISDLEANDTPEQIAASIQKIMAQGEGRFERQHRRKDGSVFDVEISIQYRSAEGGQFAVFLHDITARRQAVEALHETNKQLDHALNDLKRAQSKMLEQERLRIVGQMASGIAHDFNNSLAPILGFCELLLDRPDGLRNEPRLRQYLEMMRASAKDAASVVRHMRELYRQQPAAETLTPVNLSQLVQQAVTLTRPRWEDQARATGAQVRVEMDLAEVPLVPGNESALREVLTNLIFNAVDAMPQGGTLRLRTLRREQELILEVADSGVGMTEEVRQRCFDAFFTTKGAQGTGLGLAMVLAIIRSHDGAIDVQSKIGEGTTFTIRLPIRALPEVARPPPPSAGPFRPGRILLVEDEPAVREIFAEYLGQIGHQLTTAPDGRAGLETFTGGTFDLVVTDMAMPEMNGEQLAARIHELAPATPVILLTGFGDLMKARGEKPPGIAAVVGKPVSLSDLRDAVQEALQAHPLQPS